VRGANPDVCWELRSLPIAFSGSLSGLRSPFPSLSGLSGRTISPRERTGAFGNSPFLSRLPQQALAQANEAIAEARRLAHPPSLAANLAPGARLLSLCGDNAALSEWTDEQVALTNEQGFPLWGALGTIVRGWVKVEQGDVEEGISLLRNASAAYRATGAELYAPYHVALLAAACEVAGQVEEALTLLDDALQMVQRTGESLVRRGAE
jgi:predicted ATPase